jgi:hypothetical protein
MKSLRPLIPRVPCINVMYSQRFCPLFPTFHGEQSAFVNITPRPH